MIKNFNILFVFIILVFFSACKFDKSPEVDVQNLVKWKYTGFDDQWRKMVAPRTIQQALKNDTVLKLLMYQGRFQKTRWTDSVNWEYKTTFKIRGNYKDRVYELVFNEISGIADVYLNDSLLFTANSIYKKWNYDISDIIERGKNTIKVEFLSLPESKKNILEKSSYPFVADGYEMLRMPQYMIDTTKSIYYYTSGLTQNVNLVSWSVANIKDIYFQVLDLKYNKLAKIKANFKIMARNRTKVNLEFKNGNDVVFNKKISLKKGLNEYSYIFEIPNPKLWWTYDLGEPNLYSFTTKMFYDDVKIQEKSDEFGIRKIEIDTTDNKFVFKLNGKKLQLKTIDYYLLHWLPGKTEKKDYISAVDDFVKAGINTVHICDEAKYENQTFYKQCDKNGVLVWHDFMISYKVFDTINNYIENLKIESIENIKRIRNHPCIAFWSGANDIKSFYRKNYSSKNIKNSDSIQIFENNKLLFSKILKEIVAKYDSGAYYFENMNFSSVKKIEDNFPVYPNITTLMSYTHSNNREIGNKVFDFYNLNINVDSIIFSRINKTPTFFNDFSAFLYANYAYSSLNFYKKLLKARFNNKNTVIVCGNYKNYTPLISTSAVDYKGIWKPKMYSIAKCFKKLLIKLEEEKGKVKLSICSDYLYNIKPDFYFKLYDFNGKVHWRKNVIGANVQKQSSKEYFVFNLSRELAQVGRNFAVFKVEVFYKQELFAEKYFLFTNRDNLRLKKPNIKEKFYDVEKGFVIELSTDYFATDVLLFTKKKGKFNDNYINIAPGETRKIYFYCSGKIYSLESAFKSLDYTKIYSNNLFSFK